MADLLNHDYSASTTHYLVKKDWELDGNLKPEESSYILKN